MKKLLPLIAVCALGLTACSHATPSTPATSPSPTMSNVGPTPATQWPTSVDKKLLEADEHDPEAVAQAWVTLATSYDTRTDSNPADAMRRGERYLSPALAEHVTNSTQVRTDATWNEAAPHKAHTEISIQRIDANAPTDTPTQKYRDYEITRRWVGEDGYSKPLDPLYISIRLSQTPSGRWQISDIA